MWIATLEVDNSVLAKNDDFGSLTDAERYLEAEKKKAMRLVLSANKPRIVGYIYTADSKRKV